MYITSPTNTLYIRRCRARLSECEMFARCSDSICTDTFGTSWLRHQRIETSRHVRTYTVRNDIYVHVCAKHTPNSTHMFVGAVQYAPQTGQSYWQLTCAALYTQRPASRFSGLVVLFLIHDTTPARTDDCPTHQQQVRHPKATAHSSQRDRSSRRTLRSLFAAAAPAQLFAKRPLWSCGQNCAFSCVFALPFRKFSLPARETAHIRTYTLAADWPANSP